MNRLLIVLLSLLSIAFFSSNLQAQKKDWTVQLASFNKWVPTNYFEGFEGVYSRSSYGGVMHKYFTSLITETDAKTTAKRARDAGHNNAKAVSMLSLKERQRSCCHYTAEDLDVNNIFFAFDRSDLRASAKNKLKHLVDLLNSNPGYTAELRAHTDARGTDDYNAALSKRRRDAAVNYVLAKGISKNKLTTSTHGESAPVAINQRSDGSDSPTGRQYNRRVEVIVKDASGAVVASDNDYVPAGLKAE